MGKLIANLSESKTVISWFATTIIDKIGQSLEKKVMTITMSLVMVVQELETDKKSKSAMTINSVVDHRFGA